MTINNNASCCGPGGCTPPDDARSNDELRGQVRDGYTRIAQTGSWSALQAAPAVPAAVTVKIVKAGQAAAPTSACCSPAAVAAGVDIQALETLITSCRRPPAQRLHR